MSDGKKIERDTDATGRDKQIEFKKEWSEMQIENGTHKTYNINLCLCSSAEIICISF